jgi:sugar lactone lactonase YvrE
VTLESPSQKPANRHRLIAVAAPVTSAVVIAAIAIAASALSGRAAAEHAARSRAGSDAAAPAAPASGSPVLLKLTYTSPALGGGLYRPAGVGAANGTVFVSNTGANEVAALQAGTTTIIAGNLAGSGEHGDGGSATAATLYHPGGLAADAQGDVFIADSADNVVREVTPNGNIRLIAGTGTAGRRGHRHLATRTELDYPEGVAVNAQGDVFIADTYNNRVVEVTPQGLILKIVGTGTAGYAGDNGPATKAELNEPTGVAVDALGNLYIADASNNVIRRVDATTGIITTVAGDYAADKASGGLGGFSGDGGPATSAQLNDPQGVAVDGAGDLFIADTFDNAIREVTPGGTISTVVNSASAGGGTPPSGSETSNVAPTLSKLNTPYAVAIDPSTDVLYIADTRNSAIASVTNLAQSGDAAGPTAARS